MNRPTASTEVNITPESIAAASRRGRKPLVEPQDAPVAINETRLAEMGQALNVMAADATALAVQLGYEGSLTVGALEDEIRFYQRRTAEACLELGKRLLLLREITPHGEFQQRVDLLGIDHRTAQRFMAASLKFSKAATSPLLKAANTQGKLLELLVLDDGEIDALAEGDTARGITMDDVETMTVRELRAALRQARDAKAAAADKQSVLVRNQAEQIDKLAAEVATLKRTRPDTPTPDFQEAEALAALMDDAQQTAAHLHSTVVKLAGDVFACHPEGEASETARRGVGAALGLVLAALRDVAADFDVLPEAACEVDGLAREDQALWDAVNADIEAQGGLAGVAGAGAGHGQQPQV